MSVKRKVTVPLGTFGSPSPDLAGIARTLSWRSKRICSEAQMKSHSTGDRVQAKRLTGSRAASMRATCGRHEWFALSQARFHSVSDGAEDKAKAVVHFE